MSDPGSIYWEALVAGDEAGVAGLFAAEPVIEDPIAGRVEGTAALSRFVAERHEWLGARGASVRTSATFGDGTHSITELLLDLHEPGKEIALPVATVVAAADGGAGVEAIRVYHSTWPITGAHTVRTRLLEDRPELHADGILADYLNALEAADVGAVVACFEDDAYFREPSGDVFRFDGKEKLREIYAHNLSAGGIDLQIGSLTVDGDLTALEFTGTKWGRPVTPQAGLGLYEIGSAGKLRGIRIYDDIEGPAA